MIEEVTQELRWPAFRVEDALEAVRPEGLAHVEGNLALASRAAITFDQLGL